MAKRESNEVDLTGQEPFVHPGVTNPAAAAYLAAKKQRAGGLPKTTAPVAGGPVPPIPRLDASPDEEGLTMAQHAQSQRGGPQEAPTGFVEKPRVASSSPAQQGFLPSDMLPEQATQDPAFQQGPGSMYAAAQPELARKHGVIRNGQYVPPQALDKSKSGLSSASLEGLEKLAEAQRLEGGHDIPQPDSALGEAAGRAGNVPGDDNPETLTDEDRASLQESLKELDEFQYDSVRQAMVKDILNSDEQKKIIESRLQPLSVGDLIMNGSARQNVPIIPGQFEVTFTTVSGETDLALKRLVMLEANAFEVGDRYYLDRYSIMAIAAGTWGIMGKPLPDYYDAQGNFDDDKFMVKLKHVLKFPMHMLASLGVNQMWFDQRVRKLFSAEQLGNG